jgi:hypothetical protein
MKLPIIAVFLAVVQASVPVPRQTPNSASSTGHGVKKNADADKSPSGQSPAPIEAVTTNPEEKPSKAPKPENADQAIRISKFPSVSISRDWADWILWVFNGLLVIAGFLGIRVAYKTLGIIKRQTDATEKAAKAAWKSAEVSERALETAERADVLLESAGFILSPTTQVFDGHTRVVLRFKNFGRTRAREVSFRVRLIIPDVPDKYVPGLPRMVLGAGQSQSVSFEPFIAFLNKPTFDGIAKGDITMRFESWTVYADAFDSFYTTRDVGIFDSDGMAFRVEEHTAG